MGNQNNPTRVMLVDDHAVVRAGLKRLLEQDSLFSVVAEAESAERSYQLFQEHLPDVTIMDLSMPGMGGIEGIRRIIARYPTAKILVLSMHDNASFANQALKAGARGYLSKNGFADELADAIQWILTGKIYLSTEIAKKIALNVNADDDNKLSALSAREFEIFRMLLDGMDLSHISQTLNISTKTAANYQTSVRRKLGFNTPVEMVRLAISAGLI